MAGIIAIQEGQRRIRYNMLSVLSAESLWRASTHIPLRLTKQV